MKIIKDLGLKAPTETSTYRTKYVQVECPICGTIFEAQLRSVTSGHTKSCGCLKNSSHLITTKYLKTENPRVYSIWKNMNNRTRNTNTKQASNYVLKGIRVCTEWKDFKQFLVWALDNGYSDDLSIDRINVKGNYEPSNCRWVTRKIQSENTELLRSTNTSGYRGVSVKNNKYMARATNNITKERVYLGTFDTAELAARAYDKFLDDNGLNYPRNFANSTNLYNIEEG